MPSPQSPFAQPCSQNHSRTQRQSLSVKCDVRIASTHLAWVLITAGALITGCSDNSTDTIPAPPVDTTDSNSDPGSSLQGRLLDAAVSGLFYTTESEIGQTNTLGEFTYRTGESITFTLGALNLPTIPAASTITPLTLFNTESLTDRRVVNLARLLQTLDSDGNPENGIEIPDAASASAPTELAFDSPDFDSAVVNLVANSGSVSTELVKANTAIAHLTHTLAENSLYDSGCSSVHPFVGRTADFDTRAHSVEGQLKVIDDCTIEISGFVYDGGGPSVYFYAANNRAFGSDDAFIVGPRINGTLYNNDRFRLTLPGGKTLNDFDSIGVWCADFNANFGEAYIGDSTTQ